MGIYSRGKYRWVSYSIPKEIAAQHGCKRLVRESTGTNDAREAAKFLAKRKRELRDGTWQPLAAAGAGAGLTFASYVDRWHGKRVARGLRSEKRDMERMAPFLMILGHRRIDEIMRGDILKAVELLRSAKGRRGKAKDKAYAPMTIHRSYGVLRACFRAAVRDGVVLSNPCTLTTLEDELPPRDDADSEWRDSAVFEKSEIVLLISDERVPEHRRVLYALTFYCGLRLGEAAARKWGDYNVHKEPLGLMYVATQHEGRKLKVDKPREVPVHPDLARILAAWKERYALHYGDEATADAHIVRNTVGKRFQPTGVLNGLLRDLAKLGLRRRRVHDLRRSLITHAIDDGARGEILRFITHGRPKGVFDQYKSPSWKARCEQIVCLRIMPEQPERPEPPPSGSPKRRKPESSEKSAWN